MFVRFFLIFILASCAQVNSPKSDKVDQFFIIEVAPNKQTALVRQNLEHLIKIYDLNPYLYNKKIKIQSGVVPTSLPEIVLNTKYAEEPKNVLFLFLHFQLSQAPLFQNSAYKKLEQELTRDIHLQKVKSKSMLVTSHLNLQVLKSILGVRDSIFLIRDISKSEPFLTNYYFAAQKHEKKLAALMKKYKLSL